MEHGAAGGQLFHHLVINELLEWLISLYSEQQHTNQQFSLSDWNQLLARFNLLFPSSPQALEEQECILNLIYSSIVTSNHCTTNSNELSSLLPLHLNLLFNPLMAMKMNNSVVNHDFRANFSHPNISQYNFPTFLNCSHKSDEINNDDSILNLFTSQQLLPQYIEAVLNAWSEQQEEIMRRRKTYSSYSWIPLERKVRILERNGDDEMQDLIPDPPLVMENSDDSLREKSWRICKLENGTTIDCILSSDESLMKVDYFCAILKKYIPNLDNVTIQHSLLVDNRLRNSEYEEWIVHINDRIPDSVDESDWYSLMTCLVSYCFGECNDIFRDLFKQLDYYRCRIFNSKESEISICEITPNLIDSVFSLSEQEHLELLLVKLNYMLKNKTIGKRAINLTNWLTVALLYDLYRAEHASFLRNNALSDVWKSLQSKLPSLKTTRQIPFTFSPTFIILLLANRSYSKNNSISNCASPKVETRYIQLALSSSLCDILKECRYAAGDLMIKGSKLDFLIRHIVRNCCGISIHDWEPNRNFIQSTIQQLSNKSIGEILRENLDRDHDFNFLCSLSILIVKDRLHMKSITSLPKFSLTLPFVETDILKFPFRTTLAHPILLNRHAVKSPKWYPLVINSRTNTELLASLNEQLENRTNYKAYFGNPVRLLYERLTSIRVTVDEKIYLICFVLKHLSMDSNCWEENFKKLIIDIQQQLSNDNEKDTGNKKKKSE